MKIKTSELTGPALDWAVLQLLPDDLKGRTSAYDSDDQWGDFSTDWSQGGPIIEREKIDINYDWGEKLWTANWFGHDEFTTYVGDTPLEAAMRCYCASKLGDEVDVPEELK